ncbi:hypothetical protein BVG81_009730, partial [Haliangium sp. UPWRP_2]
MTALYVLTGREIPVVERSHMLHGELERLPYGPALQAVLTKAMAWQAAQRYQTMAGFCTELRAAWKGRLKVLNIVVDLPKQTTVKKEALAALPTVAVAAPLPPPPPPPLEATRPSIIKPATSKAQSHQQRRLFVLSLGVSAPVLLALVSWWLIGSAPRNSDVEPGQDQPGKAGALSHPADLSAGAGDVTTGLGGKTIAVGNKGIPEQLSRAQISSGFKTANTSVCTKAGASGLYNVKLTIGRNGRVSDAHVISGDYGKNCITEAVKKATFPEFSGDPMSLTYPFIVRDSVTTASGGEPRAAEKTDLPEQLSRDQITSGFKSANTSACKSEGASGIYN